MDEILDNEKIPFWKWWEGKRILFNGIVLILTILSLLILYNENFIFQSYLLYFFLGYFFVINIIYLLFTFISFIFRPMAKLNEVSKLNSFLQNKIFWWGLFSIQILIAILGLVIIIGGGSAVAPIHPSLY